MTIAQYISLHKFIYSAYFLVVSPFLEEHEVGETCEKWSQKTRVLQKLWNTRPHAIGHGACEKLCNLLYLTHSVNAKEKKNSPSATAVDDVILGTNLFGQKSFSHDNDFSVKVQVAISTFWLRRLTFWLPKHSYSLMIKNNFICLVVKLDIFELV